MILKSTRRGFLKQSLRAGAASTALGILGLGAESCCCIKKGEPGSKMKLGFVTYLWGKDWKLPTLLANCEKTGILGVETRVEHAHGVEPTLSRKERAEVKKMFADSPVTLLGPGTNACFDSPDPKTLAANIEQAKAYLQLSHDVGGTGVKVKPNSFHKDVDPKKTIEQIGKSLNVIAAFGKNLGQQVRLEVHGSCCELPTIRAIMEVADHPNATVCWNCNSQDLNGEGLEANFNMVKKRFGDTAHIRELNIGDYPYQDLMGLFVKMNFEGWILLEARTKPKDRVAAMKEQLAVFKEMVAAGQKTIG